MPSRLDTPVLTVDVGLIHKVDTRNVENLYSMWTVFSRCAGSLEEGRRLENLSWRLWNRETFCCEPTSEANATTPAISIASRSSEGRYSSDLPELSGSLDSLVDEEALEFENESTEASPLDISHPHIQRQDSCNSRSRGRERHITPDDLEKMVITIKEKKDLAPLTLSTPYLAPLTERIPQFAKIQQTASQLTEKSSTSSESVSQRSIPSTRSDSSSGTSEKSATSIVKGFSLSPAHISSSMRSIPVNTAPSSIPTADLVAVDTSKAPAPKKKQMFALGGSSGEDSLSEQAASMDNKPQQKKKLAVFSFGGSSNEEEASLPHRMQPHSSLTNKRSLITTMLHQNDRAQALATAASRSTPALRRSRNSSPNGPSLAASPESDDGAGLMMRGLKPISEIPRSVAQPIMKTNNTTAHQQALSPRTTRRNMLATELTVSLRQNLLWERRQKSSVNEAAAALKRRHTAHDVANLKQYPEKVHMDKDDTGLNSSWNQYFSQGLGEYHSKGW
ncbi:duf1752 domain containing protein [Rutstroemia sp. NJR-2017a WRK4]|nr:duf1752 domain containing protein [Rutstroemia sp. NJR-2017a WRK4]